MYVNIRFSIAFVLRLLKMSQEKNFKRKENWMKEEINALVQAVADCKDILNAKLSPSVTAERKAKTWGKVAERVNAVSSVNRSVKEVKKKWQTFQSSVKSKESKRIREASATGGGPNPIDLTETEKCALVAIPRTMLSGISGGLESDPMKITDGMDPDETEHVVPVSEEKVTSNVAEQNYKRSAENRKRKTATVTNIDHDEDFQSKILKIEERKLQLIG